MVRRASIVLGLVALVAVALASSSSGQAPGPPGGSPPGLDKAIAAKQKHADRMLDRPGVAGIGVALNGAGKPVIRIYKEKQDVADLPAELEGVPVDSVTTGVIEPRDHLPSHRFPRPVPIGVSAGLSGVATGTLGVRVTDGTNVYALSNNHVFAGINSASIGDAIISPGDVDEGIDPDDIIGTLAAYETIDFDGGDNTMDAAIALTSPANVGTSTPADGYGTPSPVTAPAFVGQAVQKYGRTTGLQLGDVAATNVSVDVCYLVLFEFCLQEARFVGQISVSPGPFSAPGDSGSLIVTQGGNQPIALLFAGGDGLTIGSPIDAVLQRFGVTIDGSSPPDGPPGAPSSLSASPGDASVSLAWNAPSFDGGSPVTGYKVYRGTSPNPTTSIAQLPVQTSYLNTGLTNGTTYYYKVSALNANGEGPLSGQAQATPTAVAPPSEPLPTLDDFNRGFENPLSDAGRWSNGVSGGEGGLYVPSTWLACSIATTCSGWRNTAQYGPDSEVWARLSVLPGDSNQLRLYARLQQPGTATYDAYMLRTTQLSGTDQVSLERVDNGTIVTLLTINQELVAGDLLLLRVQGQVLEAWRKNGSWSRIGVVADATYSGPGYTGIGLRGTTGRADDFGARTMGAPSDTESPSAPGTLTATPASATQIDLAWGAASDNVGVVSYRIERCQGASCSNFAQIATTTALSYPNGGLSASTPYTYRVRAADAAGNLGSYSNEAQATTFALAPPSEPLPTLDDFNRGFENPLSDAGRWSNGVSGGEGGLYVPSTWLACSIATTCSGWRNTAQYGPDSEVWARLSVLPGDSNQLRLYARLQQPGTATYDAYMLRTTQLSGTDQVSLERVDNGTIVTLLTINQELVAGDLLLLRVQGQVLEAWRKNGSWSRIGVVADATYSGPGYTGIGLRGTTGRADDFGARTMGAPSDTESPSAPGTLTATPASATQIDLAWGAASDNVGVVSYRIERCQGASCSNFAQIATTTALSYPNGGLSASTPYTYRVRAADAAGNLGPYSNEAQATTPALPDTEPPNAPGTLTATALSSSQIDLSWQAATDNVGVTLYRIERCEGASCSSFAEIAASTATSHLDVFLTASTAYSYRVRAEDAAGNQGPYSNTDSATTQPPPDTEPPTAPGTLTATPASSSQIVLAWGAASDDVGVTLYHIERCQGASCSSFSEIATTTALSYPNSGLSASTPYTYRVRAEDAAGNLGPYSNEASATTPAPPDTEPPSAPGSLNATPASATQIDLSWGAATDNLGVVQYRIERCQGASCSNFSEVATTTGTTYSNTSLTASTSYSFRVRAEDAVPLLGPYSNVASATTQVTPKPLYFSLLSNGTVGGLSVANEDIVSFNGATTFSLAFDGSDVGLSSRRLDAFSWLDPDTLLFSLDTDGATLPGIAGTIDDSDLVRFDASSLGETTSGTFSLYFDGSDVGLTTNAEDVDAFELLANGQLLLSTEGSVGVTGVSGADEDLLAFTPGTLGATTSGSFSLYFDGSDVGLSTSSGEDVDAAAVDAAGRIYLSTVGSFAVTSASGDDEDVFVFTPATLGTTTAGTFDPTLYFNGSAFGLAANDVFAIDLPAGI